MAIKITIPEPCHEKWHAMTPTQKGAFCDKCEKEVIDFTSYSNYELARKLGRGENLCGRFRANQLDRPLPSLERNQWRERMVALGFTTVLGLGTAARAQEQPSNSINLVRVLESKVPTCGMEPFEYSMPEIELTGSYSEHCTMVLGGISVIATEVIQRGIYGTVTDSSKMPIPGAKVHLKGLAMVTTTDFDGRFYFELQEAQTALPVQLEISLLGYETQTLDVNLTDSLTNVDTLILEEVRMGEMVVVNRPNIFRRIGNLFRRNY